MYVCMYLYKLALMLTLGSRLPLYVERSRSQGPASCASPHAQAADPSRCVMSRKDPCLSIAMLCFEGGGKATRNVWRGRRAARETEQTNRSHFWQFRGTTIAVTAQKKLGRRKRQVEVLKKKWDFRERTESEEKRNQARPSKVAGNKPVG